MTLATFAKFFADNLGELPDDVLAGMAEQIRAEMAKREAAAMEAAAA